MTVPSRPLSRPATTITRSPFLIFIPGGFAVPPFFVPPPFPPPPPPPPRPPPSPQTPFPPTPALPDQHGRIPVEADVGPAPAAPLLARPHDDRLDHVALLPPGAGKGILDGRHYDIADTRVSPARAAEHADAQNLLGTRVVGDLEPRLLLDHVNSCFDPGPYAGRLGVCGPHAGRGCVCCCVCQWPASGPGLVSARRLLVPPRMLTSPSPGSPPPASAWGRTVAWSPSGEPGRRCRRHWHRRGPCTSSCAG